MTISTLHLFSVAAIQRGARLSLVFLAATVLLLITACASAPVPPNEALQAAELAIANADQARVADYASDELRTAREKLTAAREAVQQEKMLLAKRLAEQSQVDAEMATVKANTLKAQRVNQEMHKSIEELKQEMQRNMEAQ